MSVDHIKGGFFTRRGASICDELSPIFSGPPFDCGKKTGPPPYEQEKILVPPLGHKKKILAPLLVLKTAIPGDSLFIHMK